MISDPPLTLVQPRKLTLSEHTLGHRSDLCLLVRSGTGQMLRTSCSAISKDFCCVCWSILSRQTSWSTRCIQSSLRASFCDMREFHIAGPLNLLTFFLELMNAKDESPLDAPSAKSDIWMQSGSRKANILTH